MMELPTCCLNTGIYTYATLNVHGQNLYSLLDIAWISHMLGKLQGYLGMLTLQRGTGATVLCTLSLSCQCHDIQYHFLVELRKNACKWLPNFPMP
jgi:hypothetical protein